MSVKMERHFHEELKEFKQKVLKMGMLVESAIDKAIDSFLLRKASLAEEVLEEEKIINQLEIEIDDKGHSLFALWQPMAIDLRIITAILKINTDLERMGDHAVNIAERALEILDEPIIRDDDFHKMSISVTQMLTDVLNSFINEDHELARSVLIKDDLIDQYNDEIYQRTTSLMQAQPNLVKVGVGFLIVAHNLERIGDLTNNIAENVIYMKQGKEVRHRSEQEQA